MMDNVFGKYSVAISKTTGSPNPAYRAHSGIGFEWDYMVKVYVTHSLHSQEEKEAFRQHIAVLNQLDHPHILLITDYGFEKNVPFYVTTYLTKGSLRERLEQDAPRALSIQEMITIIVQIGQALQYAHDQHIIHGNIKPENILFDTNNNAQLVDFHFPEKIGARGNVTTDTTSFSYYPQQEALNEKSDQYALGSLANELFSKLLLASTQVAIAVQQQNVIEGTAPSGFSRSTSDVLKQIKTRLAKAMATEPEERYENVAAFIAALNEVSATQFVITTPEPVTIPVPIASQPANKNFHSAKTIRGTALLPRWKQQVLGKDNFMHRLLFIAAIMLLLCFLLLGSVWLLYSGKIAQQNTASPVFIGQGLNGTSIVLTPQTVNPIRQPVLTTTAGVATHVASSHTPVVTPSQTVKPSPSPLPNSVVTPSPTANAPSTTVLAHWTFDEGSGSTISDSSGNGHTGILQGNARWGPPHAGSSALSLDGSNGTNVDISTPVVNTAQSFSVSVWVNVSSFNNNYQTFVSIDGNQISGFYLQWRRDTHRFAFAQPGSDSLSATSNLVSGSSSPATNTWYNLVGVYDASARTITLYVNGNPQQTVPDTSPWQASGHIEIGRGLYEGRPTDFVVGEIDSVYIYRGALTASDVANLATTG